MKRPAILLSAWGEGRYIDRWLLVHLLAGVVLGLALKLIGVSIGLGFAVVAVVLTGWEVFEVAVGIREYWANMVLDLVVGFAGFWLAYRAMLFGVLGLDLLLLGALSVVWAGLSWQGWRVFQNRVMDQPTIDKNSPASSSAATKSRRR